MYDISMRRLLIALIAAAVGAVALGSAQPYGDASATAPIELRVWQGLEDSSDIAVGTRAPDGAWGTLGMVPLPLRGLSESGNYRYGQTTLDVPLTTAAPVAVQVRVWQAVRSASLVYVSVRGATGSWDLLGTVRIHLDDGTRPDLGYRFGDMRIEVELPEHRVVTLAGSPMQWGYVDGVGSNARFGGHAGPSFIGLDVDADGSVIVVNYYNPVLRRVAPDGTVTTIAGGTAGLRDGPADEARFSGPTDVSVAPDGSIYISDRTNRRIRRLTPEGTVTTVAGSGPPDVRASLRPFRDGPAEQAEFGAITDIELAPDGDLYIAGGGSIRRLSPSGWVSTIAGGTHGFADGHGAGARFGLLGDMTVDASGNVYVIDNNPYIRGEHGRVATIRRISPHGFVSTIYRDDSPAHRGGRLAHPSGLVVTDAGEIYIADTGHNQIVQLMPDGELRAIAGSGEAGSFDGPYEAATFSYPTSLALAPSGALIVADQAASTVRAILPDEDGRFRTVPLAQIEQTPVLEGVSISVYAGSVGQSGFSGDGGPARSARFSRPSWMALDSSGNLIFSDTGNHAIRRISADGTVSTLAGGNGEGMDDGPASQARFELPTYLALDGSGAIFVVESGAGRIRRIAPDGLVSTVDEGAENSVQTIEQGPDGSLLIAREGDIWSRDPDGRMSLLRGSSRGVWGLAVDADGSIFFATPTSTSFKVSRLSADGDVAVVYEDPRGIYGSLFGPNVHRLAAGPDGFLYVADPDFRHVIRIAPDGTTAIVVDHTAFGSTSFQPTDILVTPEGDLLVSEAGRHVIWKITIDEDAGH